MITGGVHGQNEAIDPFSHRCDAALRLSTLDGKVSPPHNPGAPPAPPVVGVYVVGGSSTWRDDHRRAKTGHRAKTARPGMAWHADGRQFHLSVHGRDATNYRKFYLYLA